MEAPGHRDETSGGPREFHASQPTRVAGGRGIAATIGSWTSAYGSRALVVTGDSHARASGLLDRTVAQLRQANVEVELLEGVPANPSVSLVDAGARLARIWRADVLVAVGGGSVIDAAKAIATAAVDHQHDTFRAHLSGLRSSNLLVAATLPVVALPTLPGSGSETNGTSVITDDETGRKLSANAELAAPRIALLDPELALDAPLSLLGPGVADAFCHALEAALAAHASIASDAAAEQAMRMLLRVAPGLDPATDADASSYDAGRSARADAMLSAWWASNLAGQALSLAGSIVTHPLAHPLSARLDARHGSAVAALEGAVITVLRDRFAATGALSRIAGWLDVRSGSDPDRALRGVLSRLSKLCTFLDVDAGASDLGLQPEHLEHVVRDALASGSRGLVNVPGGEPDPALLYAVLDLALACPPSTSPAKLVAAAERLERTGSAARV